MRYLLFSLILSLFLSSCDELLNATNDPSSTHNNHSEPRTTHGQPTTNKGADLPARKNFTEKDLQYQGQSINLTKHGRCRMECRKLDAYEIQEVINQGKINRNKSNPNSKPCPTLAFEGKTSDGQMARVVVGTCKGNYKIVTAIDLKNNWKCNCD